MVFSDVKLASQIQVSHTKSYIKINTQFYRANFTQSKATVAVVNSCMVPICGVDSLVAFSALPVNGRRKRTIMGEKKETKISMLFDRKYVPVYDDWESEVLLVITLVSKAMSRMVVLLFVSFILKLV